MLKGLEFLKITGESGDEAHCICPFHNDNRASLSVNSKKKQWNCFACQKGGSVDELKLTYNAFTYHKQLLKNKTILEKLSARLITLEDIKEYTLGISSNRLSIPYFRKNEIVYGIKYHLIDKRSKEDKVIVEGKVPDFYPKWDFNKTNEKVYLTEGELDCIHTRKIFGKSVCTFGPVGFFNTEYLKDFKDKIVTIIMDNDPPGVKGSNSYTSKLQTAAKEIRRLILLDTAGQPVKDINDYLLKYSPEKLKATIENAPIYKIEKDIRIIEIREDYLTVEKKETLFKDSINSENYNKLMELSGIVSGKDIEPFLVPVETAIFCTSAKKGKTCNHCPLKEDTINLKINKLSRNILQLILASDSQVRHLIRTLINAPQCPEIEIKNLKMINVEELRLAPKSPEERNRGYTTKRLFKVGQEFTETNIPYRFKGIVVPDPRLQYSVILSDKAEKDKHDIDLFEITLEELKELKDFINKNNKFEGLIKIIEKISGVYYRDLMSGVILLTFASVLKFNMFNRDRRGYLSACIIGDTRTGKTELITNFINAIKLGEVISGKITSRSGIIGGCKQINGRHIINWGKIVLNTGGLLGIDESNGMSQDDFTKLTNIRSSGLAEIVFIETEKVKAETRFISLANPRSPDKMMRDYSYGVYAIKELIGKAEDISRFDLFAGVTIDSIDKEKLYEAMEKGPTAKEKDIKLMRKLILFAWTRKIENVKISKLVIQKIKKRAMNFNYSATIPLIERNEAMYKITRISIAMAVTNGNFNLKGDIELKPSDVDQAADFMILCIEDPALNYGEYSATFSRRNLRNVKGITEKVKYFGVEFIEGMLSSSQLTLKDLGDYSGLSELSEVRDLASYFVRSRALVKSYTFYEKSPEFINLLRKISYQISKGGKND